MLDHQVWVGNPADAPLLALAVGQVSQRAGRMPRAATADRDRGEAAVDDVLGELGVTQVAIPRKGTPSPPGQGAIPAIPAPDEAAHRSEGRISHLKHRYSWDRTLMDGIDGPGSGAGREFRGRFRTHSVAAPPRPTPNSLPLFPAPIRLDVLVVASGAAVPQAPEPGAGRSDPCSRLAISRSMACCSALSSARRTSREGAMRLVRSSASAREPSGAPRPGGSATPPRSQAPGGPALR